MNMFELIKLAAPESQKEKVGMLGLLPGLGGGSPGPTSPKPESYGPNTNWERVARQMAFNDYGYSRPDWRKLDYIIERESHWNPDAVNPNGGAYGIPQILPRAHPDVNLQNDPLGQLKWLFNYINNKHYQGYGTGIDAAYRHKRATGWY